MKKIALLIAILALLPAASVRAQGIQDKNVLSPFGPLLEQSPDFYDGDVCRIAKIGDDMYVLSVAYGITTESGFSAKKKAKRVAEVTADRQMVALLSGQNISSETFMEETEISVDDETTFRSFFSQKTKEEVEGLLLGAQNSGSWWLQDGDERVFFVLRSVKLTPQQLDGTGGGAAPAPTSAPASSGVSTPAVTPPSGDPDVIVVVAVGVADFMGNKDYSKAEALKQATRNAVEQALGTLMKSETVVEDGQLKRDRMLSNTGGMVKAYEVIKEGPVGDDSYRVEIRADVSRSEVERTAQQFGLLVSQMGKPKVAIIPYETMNGARLEYDSSPMTTALNDIFLADPYNIRPIDMYQSMITKKQQQPELWEKYQRMLDPDQQMDVTKFGELGINCDIIVKGEIFLTHKGKDSDGVFDQYEATVVLKILWAGTGEMLGQFQDNATTNGDSAANAMIKVVKRLTPRINPLIEQMERQFNDIANNGQLITIDMRGIPSGRKGRKLKRDFKSGVENLPKVKQIEKRNEVDDFVNFDVTFLGTSSDFQELLVDYMDDELGDWMDDNEYDFNMNMKGGSLVFEWVKDE